MSSLDAGAFYSLADEALQQGDILLGAVARVIGDDHFSPEQWLALDEARALLAPAVTYGAATMPALRVAAGRALVMVCTHDCGLDKEFNAAITEATHARNSHPLSEPDAIAWAEGQPDLDRAFTVSPLVAPESVRVAGAQVDQGLLMGGRIVGFLPVPELLIDGAVVVPASVVDLGYRVTLDRTAYTQRISCISDRARAELRYAMARLDVLRTPSLEIELAHAVGQAITNARVAKKNPLVVELTLDDGTIIELLKKPGDPPPGPRSRTRRSVLPAAEG